LNAAVTTLEADASIGAVGGRLVLPDGTLQEAGSIVWHDGSCAGYGRGDSPEAPAYQFTRDVDFCSGAFLMTRLELFRALGGFDELYRPAYYEDVDYCVRLWKRGYRVVYQPTIRVWHYEFGSAPSRLESITAQEERRATFAARHADWLMRQPASHSTPPWKARVHGRPAGRILVFDDQVPHSGLGSGLPRALELARALVALGWQVTWYPLWITEEPWDEVYAELPRAVEVMLGRGPAGVADFLSERRDGYDAILISRTHNLERLRAALGAPGKWTPGIPMIFDAEAVQGAREALRAEVLGLPGDPKQQQRAAEELRDVGAMSAVMCVSRLEQLELARLHAAPVHLVTHAVEIRPGGASFDDRHGLLFVGAFRQGSPNIDAVLWFCEEVMPILERRLGLVELTVVGHAVPAQIAALEGARVRVVEDAPDLVPFYDAARLAIAPTRFAAGIPLKIIHAAAHGLPVVCTRLLADQLGWSPGREVFAADGAQGFANACIGAYSDVCQWDAVRRAALDRVSSDYSRSVFTESVARCLAAAGAGTRGEVTR
jgi:glycosyltransferase involved in cell wall biosynthesis